MLESQAELAGALILLQCVLQYFFYVVDFLTILTIVYYIFFCIGSASTGSTKSATMELYTSSYNETMSGGGETLSSISEKSCISNPNNQGSGSQAFPTQAYLMVMIIFGAKIQISLIFFYFWRKNSYAI